MAERERTMCMQLQEKLATKYNEMLTEIADPSAMSANAVSDQWSGHTYHNQNTLPSSIHLPDQTTSLSLAEQFLSGLQQAHSLHTGSQTTASRGPEEQPSRRGQLQGYLKQVIKIFEKFTYCTLYVFG